MTEGKPVVLVLRYIRYLDRGMISDTEHAMHERTLHPEPHVRG